MSHQDPNGSEELPEAKLKTHRKSHGASAIWLIPLVAAVIGAGIGYQIYSQRGATIQISFENAEGLEADKTSIRYLNVVIGTVSEIVVAPDMKSVLVTAEMTQESSKDLVEGIIEDLLGHQTSASSDTFEPLTGYESALHLAERRRKLRRVTLRECVM